jgi:hypothetical protein
MAKIWTFFDYLEVGGTNPVREWINAQPKAARLKIDKRIEYMENTLNWAPQYFSAIRGYSGIYELRIICQNVQYRPLGCFGPNDKEFTLLIGASEHGDQIIPRNAFGIAESRMGIVLGDRRRTREHEFRYG